MRNDLANFIGKTIIIWLNILFGLVPLFFVPLTSEFYEFNKVLITSLSAAVLLILWLTKSALLGKFKIRTSIIDIAVIIFAFTNILAASFSVDRYVSIAGWYPRFNHSLIFILAVIVIYFVTANNLTKRSTKFTILSIYLSAVLLSIIGLMNYFGLFLPMSFSQIRSWTPATSINNLGVILTLSVPLGIYLSIKKYSPSKSFLSFVFPVSLLPILWCFSLINSLNGWISLIVIIALLALTSRKELAVKKSLILALVALVWMFLTIFAYIPNLNTSTYGKLIKTSDKQTNSNIEFPKEVSLPQAESYSVSVGVIRNQNRALIGSGQGTFAYAYTQLKPQSINLTQFWNLRFDQPNSEVLMILAGTGILGIASFILIALIILAKTLKILKNNSEDKLIYKYIALTVLILIITSLGNVYTASISLIFFGLLGAINNSNSSKSELSLKKSKKQSKRVKEELSMAVPVILLIPTLVGSIFLFAFIRDSFQAETHFQKSALATSKSDGVEALKEQIAAIKENSAESVYRKQLIVTYMALARSILQNAQSNADPNSTESPLTEQEEKDITSLISQAIEQGKIITGYQTNIQSGTSNLNVGNWESLSQVYRSLIGIGKDAEQHALKAQQQAIALDPQNPLLYINLGRTFLALGITDSAITNFEIAIQKKPDYPVGYIALAEALKNRPDSAAKRATALETALNLLSTENPSRENLTKEWEKALVESQSQQEKSDQTPTVPNSNPTPQTATNSAQPTN
ncbi:O-antigen ligase family protein [Candidatus Curtissbacteria bacterium]|nr:O-antigen ligase family protein [Candidatus Curtissbacteria bacterium]